MEALVEEGEGGGVKAEHNGAPPNMAAKKTKKAVAVRKKVKGQTKARRRTVNPKKAKKGDRHGGGGAVEEDSSEGEQWGKGTGASGRSQQKPYEGSGESSEEDEVGVVKKGGEDEEWNKLQESVRKHSKKKFENNKTESHPVHAPYFPEVGKLLKGCGPGGLYPDL